MKPYEVKIIQSASLLTENLYSRWTQEIIEVVYQCIKNKRVFPDYINELNAVYEDKTITLIDLRGVNLSDRDLSGGDFTYCALDYANLSKCNLTDCLFQYATLKMANLTGANLERVQASPIDASRANFSLTTIRNSFFMLSNMDNVNFTDSGIFASRFKGAKLNGTEIHGVIFVNDAGQRNYDPESLKKLPVDQYSQLAFDLNTTQQSMHAYISAVVEAVGADDEDDGEPTKDVLRMAIPDNVSLADTDLAVSHETPNSITTELNNMETVQLRVVTTIGKASTDATGNHPEVIRGDFFTGSKEPPISARGGLGSKLEKHSSTGGFNLQFREKQRIKNRYGLLERQLQRYILEAERRKGNTGTNLLALLENRLDSVVYRMGFSSTLKEARQILSRNELTVNGKTVSFPWYQVKAGDIIAFRDESKSQQPLTESLKLANSIGLPRWVSVDSSKVEAIFKNMADQNRFSAKIKKSSIARARAGSSRTRTTRSG